MPEFVPVFGSLAHDDFDASATKKPANEAGVMEVMENITKSKCLRIQFKTRCRTPTVSTYSPCGHAALTQLINCLPLSTPLLTADPSSLPLSLQGSDLQQLAAAPRLCFATGPCRAELEACKFSG